MPFDDVAVVTTFGKETSFKGKLSYNTSLKIEGSYEGSIKTNGLLIIDENAKVIADIEAGEVLIAGYVKGDIVAIHRVELLPTAKMFGDITTTKLKIADGVVFEGNCKMYHSKEQGGA